MTDNELEDDPLYAEFASVFSRFLPPDELDSKDDDKKEEDSEEKPSEDKEEDEEAKPEEVEEKKEAPVKKVSRRERKRQKQLEIAILKQLVKQSDLVEVHDVNSSDPLLLIHLKAYRNTVPVPRHWSQKRKYLQGKRGIEKPPFRLPDFIAATGIMRIRDAVADADDGSLKSATRERVNPTMGKLDIDYEVLRDAFFEYQTKPKMTGHGDTYYESKEFEVNLKEKVPGLLSAALKSALGMGDGSAPPWLINQQRYGPPPSYPNLKIPGLNAPIPAGASFGYHAGGWGKPPVDEVGRPLYGDVFGKAAPPPPPEIQAPIEFKLWGELEEEEYESSEGEESEEEEESDESGDEGEEAESDGIASVQSGMVTPDTISLRKDTGEKRGASKPLFQVLEEKQTKIGSGAMFGSSTKYVVPGSEKSASGGRVDLFKSQKGSKVDITLDPAELESAEGVTEDMLKKKYQEQVKSKASQREDVSDLMADQERKRKRQAEKDSKSKKKFKDLYKF